LAGYEKSESPASKVTVKAKPTTTLSISPQEVEVAVNEKVTFGGKLLATSGPVKGKTVYLIINKKEEGQCITDEGGNWQITYTFPKEGTYKVKAVYKGD